MTEDPITEIFFYKKNLDICSGAAGYISSDEIFSFSNNKNSRSSNFLFQKVRGSGATLSECAFFEENSKKRTSLKRLLQDRTTSRLHFERTRTKLDSLGKARETRRSSSSTMKCSGVYRCETHGVPRKEGRRSSLTRIPPI
jgi:hypothetical protein